MSSNSGIEKPNTIQTIAVLTLISGILNVIWGLGLTVMVVLGTLFLGIICAPLTILPTVLGVFEIIYASRLLASPPSVSQPSQWIAIFEIIGILSGNIISLVTGILALVVYNNPEVKAYFAGSST